MNRLTKRMDGLSYALCGNVIIARCENCKNRLPSCYEEDCPVELEILHKLARHEDLEEQGRLVERKYGYWIYKHDEEGNTGNAQYECSECGAGDIHAKSQEVPYCWKCGAKLAEKGGGE